MSGRLAQLTALFIAPPTDPTPVAARDAAAPPCDPPAIEWRPPVDGRRLPTPRPAVSAAPPVPIDATHDRVADDGSVSAAQRPEPPTAAVLGVGADTASLAAALAGELRTRHRARTALLLVWDPSSPPPAPMPAWPATRRLAATLAPGHDVAARGFVVFLRLPGEPVAAAAAATELSATAGVPTVLALCAPRSPAFDGLLRSRDVVVVSASVDLPGGLAELAVTELRRLNHHVLVASDPVGGARRLLASSGLSRARSLGVRLDPAVT